MIGQQIDERRWYGRYDKRNILKRTYGMCACCGKKLTEKTMSIEHVIPISRGGLDSERNTIALCKTCNETKSNMLYIPLWFYTALTGKPLINELTDMFKDWFSTVKDEFPIELYPLIAPRHNLLLHITTMRNHKNKQPYIRDNVIQWHYTGKQYMDEVQAVTGRNLWDLRNIISSMMPKTNDNHPVALYTCRKLTTDKILALVACAVDIEHKVAIAYVDWSELPKDYRPSIYYSFLRLMFNVFDLGNYDIEDIAFIVRETDDATLCNMYDYYLPGLSSDIHKTLRCRMLNRLLNTKTGERNSVIQIQTKEKIADYFSLLFHGML